MFPSQLGLTGYLAVFAIAIVVFILAPMSIRFCGNINVL
jgi:hypothetical protein